MSYIEESKPVNEIYSKEFYEKETELALSAAQIILPYILNRISCKTIIDFGCGTGKWLHAAKKISKEKIQILGLDGEYAREYLEISSNEFLACDLTKIIDLKSKYDLAISLEVAEHLPITSAKTFIQNLTRHSNIILFSAAVPYQGGTKHINEQYPSYWEKIFSEYGFVMCDCLRSVFWNDERIDMCYRQNMFLYCKAALQKDIKEKFITEKNIIDIIHPDYWKKEKLNPYLFPFESVEYKNKIIMYGAGTVGKAYMNQILATNYAEVTLWCDSSFKDYESQEYKIANPMEIINVEYDHIVIAVKDKKTAIIILNHLIGMGVIKEKIIWRNPICVNRI